MARARLVKERPASTPADRRRPIHFAAFLLLADAALVALIVAFVPYTKIDWDAYMSQVDAFREGERDYTKIEGDTGPLVYPAGFLYVYSAIKFLTAGQVFPAQILFGVLYLVNMSLVLLLYVKTEVLPWWALGLLCLSKRVHSIFVLRLFNDCVAMTLLHAAMVLIVYHKWYLGLIIFSGAVSVKMNVLLFAPSLFLLMLKAMSIKGVFLALLGAAGVQVLLGIPFLLSHPVEYISRAFNLGRVFIHFWSVNFKFVPEKYFVSKELAIGLLIFHLTTLMVFAHYNWFKHEGGLFHFVHSRFRDATSIQQLISCKPRQSILSKEHIVTVMFVGNFIGIVCARSLHYQFYSWYFYSLPFLLWRTKFPTVVRIILFVAVELCWNVYPSTAYSSLLLLFAHLFILFGLWSSPAEYPHVDKKEKADSKESGKAMPLINSADHKATTEPKAHRHTRFVPFRPPGVPRPNLAPRLVPQSPPSCLARRRTGGRQEAGQRQAAEPANRLRIRAFRAMGGDGGTEEELTAQETALYDRQIRVWGVDAQKRLSKAHVLVCGVNGTTIEFCKNIVLAGVGSLSLMDDHIVTEDDLSANFLIPHDVCMQGVSSRAEACCESLKDFNPMVRVAVAIGDPSLIDEGFVDRFDIIVVSCASLKTKLFLNDNCRKRSKHIAFYSVECKDSCGEIFVDLQNHSYLQKKPGGEPEQQELTYASLQEAISVPWKNLPKKTTKLYYATRVLESYELSEGRDPGETGLSDLPAVLAWRKDMCDRMSLSESQIPTALLERLLAAGKKEHPPVCAILGGILGQEVIKSISCKGDPIKNFFYYDAADGKGIMEDIPPTPVEQFA
ncbi:dol-P-Man:Man(5)GlcNAc(2)-PP-Dol alpha-1,3-mannosyltransferase [Triticum urartu]|nr:dol-P-Man:Man(5)GlcNAc(2)-PP-Dol alpha-1,3-mannosyltransferase [Triticum urartu]